MRHEISLDPAPGSGLFLPPLWAGPASVLDAGERYGRLREATGLAPGAVVAPLWANIALPVLDHEHARLAPINDAFAGHPFLWLPERLLARYELVDDDGTTTDEGLDTWMCRVLLEALAAGWYDRPSGRWVDVLADAGADAGRVRDWVAGASDPVLDELEAPLGSDDAWAIAVAQEMVPALREASDALGAVEIATALKDAGLEIVQACATSAQCLEVVDGEPRCPALWAELAAAPDRDDLLAEGLNHLTHLRDGGQDAIAFLADVLVSPDGLEGVT